MTFRKKAAAPFAKKEPQMNDQSGTSNKAKLAPNPYLDARRSWNDHTGSLVWQRRMWQMVALGAVMVVLAAVGGLIHVGSQSRFVPYVVEVDKVGTAMASGVAQKVGAVDSRIIRAKVGEFISKSRLVTPDRALQRDAIFDVYAMMSKSSSAFVKMREYHESNPPTKRAQSEIVSIKIKSILPQTADTWQVDWVEDTRSRDGKPARPPVAMKAVVTVYTAEHAPGTPEEQLIKNPLGIFVEDFSWSEIY